MPKPIHIFKYHSKPCVLCDYKIKILDELDEENMYEMKLTEQERKEYAHLFEENSKTYTYGQYVLRAGTLAALQMGYLCSVCSQKELKDRIKTKF